MLNPHKHRLLRRQIKKAGFTNEELVKFQHFFNDVDDAYQSFDNDVKHIETILEKSSNELYKSNKLLRSQILNVEFRLNAIVNNIEGVIFKTDTHGTFEYLNEASEELFGIPVDELLNKNFTELLEGIKGKQRLKILEAFIRNESDFNTVFKFIKPSGDKIWVELRLQPSHDITGAVDGAIGTMMDITKLKDTEIELKQANKIKDEFLSTMSHEIKTPLNAVIGMSDILLMEKFLPEQAENLQVLKYSSEHLLALINDLLSLNKYKSKQVSLKIEDFNLSEFVQNMQLHFKQVALNKNLFFDVILDTAITEILKGDSLKLSQVIKNLLSNAFKFTDSGGVTFQTELLERKEHSSLLRFSVKDTGIGVSYNKQKNIFKSFVQANENTSQLYGGSGLGLYISKELLQIQNSQLQIESKKGEGAKFWFDIELKHSKSELLHEQKTISKTAPIDIKVLVAEDNNLNALLLKKLFNKWNVDFVIAKNGEALLDVFKTDDFNLILMDLQMPILDGYQTARVIRKMDDELKSNIPIIALTAFAEAEVGEKIARYKMNGYLSKPLKVNELHSLLEFYSHKKQQVV
ncbi:response regulator [Winogradskyella sediminis]|uniref:PAS domain-containing hybrid sensor histidine kinase/response regulator n=1 Tax=Winogradskyella sediminis TaxID=1382466 RepID=UPI003AA96904